MYHKKLLGTITVTSKYYKSKSNVSTRTIRQIHKILKCAFGVVVNWNLIAVNPFDKVKPPKHVYTKRKIWDSEIIMKAIDLCEDPKLIISIHLAFACSLRSGEILGLQWRNVHISEEDIAIDNAHINVEQQLERVSVGALDKKDVIFEFPSVTRNDTKTKYVLKKPKITSSIRKIWLPRTLAYILKEWYKKQQQYKDFFGTDYKDYDLVVCFEDGRNCNHGVIRNSLRNLIEENDLPLIVFHSLRHSSTTYQLKLNHGDIKATQGDTGHAQVDMVTEVYGHIMDEDRKVNAQKFNESFYSENGQSIDHQETQRVNVNELVSALKSNPELLDRLLEALKKIEQLFKRSCSFILLKISDNERS